LILSKPLDRIHDRDFTRHVGRQCYETDTPNDHCQNGSWHRGTEHLWAVTARAKRCTFLLIAWSCRFGPQAWEKPGQSPDVNLSRIVKFRSFATRLGRRKLISSFNLQDSHGGDCNVPFPFACVCGEGNSKSATNSQESVPDAPACAGGRHRANVGSRNHPPPRMPRSNMLLDGPDPVPSPALKASARQMGKKSIPPRTP